ncbi:hypothetical protein, partial [Streptomyces sp. NPDC006999]|uniref:hypothetical protein n=1 Tax=Streptomyces sp. NPDC006999 TaxID=3156909 RepID=UPI0033E285F8
MAGAELFESRGSAPGPSSEAASQAPAPTAASRVTVSAARASRRRRAIARLQDEDTGEEMLPFEALESDAVFDRVTYNGA